MSAGSTESTAAAPADDVRPASAAPPVRPAPDADVAGCDGPDGAKGPAGSTCTPRVGRPRSVAADTAILDATVELFADLGFEGVSIEAVAERAGVAKSTVYRRYPTKIDLVMAAWEDCSSGPATAVDTGSLTDDLVAAAQHLRAVFTESRLGRAVPSALAAKARFPEFGEAHDRFIAARRAPMVAMIERSIEAGALRPDTDAQLLIDLITGTIFYRAFNTGGSLADDHLRALVDHAVDSFR